VGVEMLGDDASSEIGFDARGADDRVGSGARRLLALAGLSGVAISQPALSMLGENPEFFIFHEASIWDALALALILACVPALLLWGVTELVRRASQVAGEWSFLASIGGLASLAVVGLGTRLIGVGGAALVVVALGVGTFFAIAFRRLAPVRSWSVYLAAVIPLALLLFVLGSPSGEVLRATGERDAVNSTGEHPSVVVLLLDELPTASLLTTDGSISTTRTPNLAALTDEMTWYPNFTVRASRTTFSLPTLLTGDVDAGPPAVFTEHPDNLFTLLADTHRIWASETITKFCPFTDCDGNSSSDTSTASLIGQGLELTRARLSPTPDHEVSFDDFASAVDVEPADDPVPPLLERFDDPVSAMRGMEATVEKPALFQSFLDGIRADAQPSLHFLHLMLPHQPWRFLPDGEVYTTPLLDDGTFPFDRNNELGPWVSALTEYRHLLQLQYTDTLVGELVAHLKETGVWDESLVVVAADHGISFQPGTPIRTLTPDTLDEIAYAPLFVKLPGQDTGGIDEANVRAADLLPTIADGVGVEIPFPVDGLPLGDARNADRGDRKVIRDIVDGVATRDRGTIEYTIADTKPSAAGRLIGELPSDSPPIHALNVYLGIDDLVGHELATLADTGEGEARVNGLGALESPPDEEPDALVTGTVPGATADDLVLVAIDGVVRTGSQIIERGGSTSAFAAMLPSDTVTESKDLEIALRHPDGTIVGLDLTEG
jgi:hypothetical protein